jgi:hypothetical protein
VDISGVTITLELHRSQKVTEQLIEFFLSNVNTRSIPAYLNSGGTYITLT